MTLGVVSALLPSLGHAEDLLSALGTEHPAPLFDDLLADDRFADLRPMFAAYTWAATESTMVIPVVTEADPDMPPRTLWEQDQVPDVRDSLDAEIAASILESPGPRTMATRPRA